MAAFDQGGCTHRTADVSVRNRKDIRRGKG